MSRNKKRNQANQSTLSNKRAKASSIAPLVSAKLLTVGRVNRFALTN